MSELSTQRIASFDGTQLAVHRLGAGRPVLLLHGLFSSAEVNWIKFGHAALLAEAGFEAIMPDLRAHGESDSPLNPLAYPPDVLVRDAKAVVNDLGLTDYHLVGFSLGARTSVQAVAAGLEPDRLVLAGMGLQGLFDWDRRAGFFLDMIHRFDAIERGDPAWFAKSFMVSMGIYRDAAKLLLEAVDEVGREDLAALEMPTAVVCGDEDRDNGSPEELANVLPAAKHIEIPGTHMSCVTRPALGRAICDFLLDG